MSQALLTTFLFTAATIFIYYNVCFILAIMLKRNDIADVAWGIGFIIASISPLVWYRMLTPRSMIVTSLVILWGMRLSAHIYARNKNNHEDYRYAAWRESWSSYFYLKTYLNVFLLQGVLLMIIVTPVLFINTYQNCALNILDLVGLTVWIIGFMCEAVADYQLKIFLQDSNNKGQLLTTGLWHYSRHPNYFGEITQWWGIFIMALSIKYGFLTILGPLIITFLIVKVSGIPLLEKKMSENQSFEAYKNKTSMLIPWFSGTSKT